MDHRQQGHGQRHTEVVEPAEVVGVDSAQAEASEPAGHHAAGHGDPRAHAGHGASHDRHQGHSVAMFRDRFWLSLRPDDPGRAAEPRHPGVARLRDPDVPGLRLPPGDPRHDHLRLRRHRVPARCSRRARGPPARDDDPDLARHRGRLRHQLGGTLGLFEVEIWWELATLITIMLLGHWLEMRSIAQARGALAALAELLPDTAERVTRGRDRDGPARALAMGDIVLVRPGATGSGRRRCRRRAGRRRRVDDHGRIAPGPEGAGRPGRRGHGRGRRHRCASGSRPSGSRRPCRGSCGWSPRRRHRARAPRRSPIAPRRCSSTSRSAPAPSRSSAGGCWGTPRARWSAPRPSSSSPVRMRSASPSRSSSRSRRRSARGTACSSRTGWRSSARGELDVVIFDKTGTLTQGEPVARRHRGRAGDRRGGRLLELAAAVEADSEHPLARAIVAAREARVRTRPARGLRGAGGPWRSGARSMVGRSRSAARACWRISALEMPPELAARPIDGRAEGVRCSTSSPTIG